MLSFQHIPACLEELNFRHLQLHPSSVQTLKSFGVIRLVDLKGCDPSVLDLIAPMFSVITERAALVAKHSCEKRTDWPAFWREPGVQVHWMAMTFEDASFCENMRKTPLALLHNDFGALLNIPNASGVATLGEVLFAFQHCSLPWRGFGHGKVRRMGEILAEIELGLRVISPAPPKHDIARNNDSGVKHLLPDEVLNWDISALGLGAGGDKLRRNLRDTVGSVVEDPDQLRQLPGVGRQTITLLKSRLSILAEAVMDGALDLNKLASLQGFSLIPQQPLTAGNELTSHVAAVIQVAVNAETVNAEASPAAPIIFEHRICKSGSDALSLEDVGQMIPTVMTRERVRQVENSILRRAAGMLFSAHPILGMPLIQPALREMFSKLSVALGEQQQIAPADLALLISKEWNCRLPDAIRVLPLVMAVIEGTARGSAELKRFDISVDGVFAPLSEPSKSWSVQNIGGDRGMCQMLKKLGIVSLENLRQAWMAGQHFGRHEIYIRHVLEAACVAPNDANMFADRLFEVTAKEVVPAAHAEWSKHIETLSIDIVTIIKSGTFRADADFIFSQRTSRLKTERPTTEVVGARLGRLGVTVKQTETDTLQRLGSVLLEGDGSYAQSILRPDWIKMWRDMKMIFNSHPDNPNMVVRAIGEAYDVEEETMTMAFPTIWAVLSGLPTRQAHGKARIQSGPSGAIAPVVLSGFRPMH